jgi:hypothetical protein
MCWVGGSIATGNVFLDTEYLLDKNYYITLQQNRITAYECVWKKPIKYTKIREGENVVSREGQIDSKG